MHSYLSITVKRLVILFVTFFGIASTFGQDVSETAPGKTDSETDVDEVADQEAPERTLKERTPMSMPTYALFGESQRGMPSLVNPVIPSLSDLRFRFGTLLDFGFGLEIGDVADHWVSDLDDVLDDLDKLVDTAERIRETLDAGGRPEATELNEFLDGLRGFEGDANVLVDTLAQKAYLKVTASASFPLVPIAVRSDTLRGMFTLNADAFAETRGGIYSANSAFDFGLNGLEADDVETITFDEKEDTEVIELTGGRPPVRIEAEADAGIAIQGGAVGRIGAGYSGDVWSRENGRLLAGTTVNYYRATLIRTGVMFDEDSFGDAIEDSFDDSDKTTNGFGIDIGAAWVGQGYLIGGVARNINEPKFDYPDTSDSEFFNRNPLARRNGESWTMNRQFTLQGALFTADKRWIASGSVDLNSATDTTGDDYRWASILGAFEPARGWVPSPRLGVRTNLTGEKLTYVTAGLTFFRALHLDVSSTVDTVKVDGDSVPRAIQINLALGRRF